MEKLIMLLDIYEEEVVGAHSVGDKITEKDESWICSKKFGFIKWLVDNDKIDGLKFYGENEYTPIGVNTKSDIDQVYSVKEQILMLLSISDTPIDDLISYLK